METKKAGRGRPIGKVIKWSGIVWHSMTNAQIAAAVGTSVPNVWMRRARMLKDGKKVAYKGEKYTHFNPKAQKPKKTATPKAKKPVIVKSEAPAPVEPVAA